MHGGKEVGGRQVCVDDGGGVGWSECKLVHDDGGGRRGLDELAV